MYVKVDIYTFDQVYDRAWAGARDTCEQIRKFHKEKEFMEYIDEIFYDGIDQTEFNDFLWFEDTEIFRYLGIDPYGDGILEDA